MRFVKCILKPSCLLLAAVLICAAAAGIYTHSLLQGGKMASTTTYMQSKNLALDASSDAQKAIDGDSTTVFRSGKRVNQPIIIDLKEPKTFNSVVLREAGLHVKAFALSVSDDNKAYRQIFRSDKIEYHRLCTFDAVKARYLMLTILEADAYPTIREIEIYDEPARADTGFRTTAYLSAGDLNSILAREDITEKEKEAQVNAYLNSYDLQKLTHLFYFCGVSFDETGLLFLGQKTDDQARLQQNLALLLRCMRPRMRPDVKLSFVMGNSLDGPGMNLAMGENGDVFLQNIIAFANRFGFDGVDIDYEFPQTDEEFKIYGDFLIRLKSEMDLRMAKGENNLLSCAFGTRDLNYPQEVIDALDMVNIMTYDIMDQDGQHASFWSCTEQAGAYVQSIGFRKEQINLGIPFYGTQTQALMEQYIYKDLKTRAYDANLYTVPSYYDGSLTQAYFNSPSMVRDKTAFTLLNGYGGVMLFSLTCDTDARDEFSLMRAVGTALDQFGGAAR